MILNKLFFLLLFLILSILVGACGSSLITDEDAHHYTRKNAHEHNDEDLPEMSGYTEPMSRVVQNSKGSTSIADSSSLDILDTSIKIGFADAYELLHKDINTITEDSGVIFVGRVIDYKERLYIVPPSPDLLAASGPNEEIVIIVEGIVLEADEVLLGEMP